MTNMKSTVSAAAAAVPQYLSWHLNDSGMSDIVMKDLLQMSSISNRFRGIHHVHHLDKIKLSPSTIAKDGASFIVNIGSHFVALIIFPTYVLYIDSFGIPIRNARISQFLHTNFPHHQVYSNRTQLQSIDSSHCGLYATLFILYFDVFYFRPQRSSKTKKNAFFHLSFHPITSEKNSKTNGTMNDKLCIEYIKSLSKM